jgi:hypothetical protein
MWLWLEGRGLELATWQLVVISEPASENVDYHSQNSQRRTGHPCFLFLCRRGRWEIPGTLPQCGVAVATDISNAKVVGHEEEDVGPGARGGEVAAGRPQSQEHGQEDRHTDPETQDVRTMASAVPRNARHRGGRGWEDHGSRPDPVSSRKPGVQAHTCNPSYTRVGTLGQRGQNGEGRDVSKCDAPGSNPSTAKNQKIPPKE